MKKKLLLTCVPLIILMACSNNNSSHVHTWNEGTVTTNATCTEAGVMTYTCTSCQETKTEAIPALGHDYQLTSTTATCLTGGVETYTCSRDSSHTETKEVSATGHQVENDICKVCASKRVIKYDISTTQDESIIGEVYQEDDTKEEYSLVISGKGTMNSYECRTEETHAPWYKDYSGKIKNLYILDGVTNIGENAFYYMDIENVFLPSTITTIKSGAFIDNDFTSITLPENITEIAESTFAECSNLESIVIPNKVTTIGKSAFSGCRRLESIIIPNNVTTICDYAFSRCMSLSSFNLPKQVIDFGVATLSQCTSLQEITVDSENPNYKAEDNILYSKDGTIIYQYALGKSDTSFTIPNNVTKLEEYSIAFSNNLKKIYVPKTVTNVEYSALYFSDTSNSNLYCESESKPADWYKEFTNLDDKNVAWNYPLNAILVNTWEIGNDDENQIIAYLYKKSEDNYFLTFSGNGETKYLQNAPWKDYSDKITSVNVNEGITTLSNFIFQNLTAVTSYSLPSTLIKIGTNAFLNNKSLKSIIIPKKVTTLYWPFAGCSTELVINCYCNESSVPQGWTLLNKVSGFGENTESFCTVKYDYTLEN